MEACLENAKAKPDKTKTVLEEMEALIYILEGRFDKIDTTGLEANRIKSEAVAVHLEIPIEEAAVEIIGAVKPRYGDRHLVLGRCRQPKKRTQGNGGSPKKFAAARRRTTCHAVHRRRMGRSHKELTVEKRRRKGSNFK
jgi:hypothetical protein